MKRRGLTEQQIKEIRILAKTMRQKDIAEIYKVSPQLVSMTVLYGYEARPDYASTLDLAAYRSWENVALEYNRRNPEDQITAKEARDCFSKCKRRFIKALASMGLNESNLF